IEHHDIRCITDLQQSAILQTQDLESKIYRPDTDLAGVAALFSRQNGDERFTPLYWQRFKS
ncbi:hypothetical protein, partial [Citrobacter freundii]|uniref:hypothetical protein n=1 Tax=Citrobacter freundii TaxID=546 RepID=UPI002F969EC0